MTTTVTVKTAAHAARVSEYPYDADLNPLPDAEYREIATVAPHSEQTFAAHAHADILVQELPQDA
jgi:hypothetical protein